jgi:hypothetical protein
MVCMKRHFPCICRGILQFSNITINAENMIVLRIIDIVYIMK